ncbi:SIR2 family protein [Dyadobacter sp. CY347]|uniref:SIR2 family protein n=1 Tax=Dyadobacter sp. CY347 TaxID=2909336 RepID=UPI001F3B0807|nr:SIR2 family protein [Dyadobacter sp. CY347]MCF2491517.1 SIR2 family protein [Dyadobacter sp. CY347]
MSKEALFELIRTDDVVLWAGSGLSKYAGYPTGNELRDTIFKQIKEPALQGVSKQLSLDLIAQALQDENQSKSKLNNFLISTFNRESRHNKTHKKIAKIPHFKTIITTNYDKLFEQCYGSNIRVAIEEQDLTYLDRTKVELFKIHGCVSRPGTFVITKDDYLAFFKANKELTPYWTVVKDRIIRKPIAFIGYGLSDDNVNVTIEKLTEILGDHRRECYFISPNASEQLVRKLNIKKINYINLTGEKFINELIQNIKDNIHLDFQERKVSREICEQFISNYGVSIETKRTNKGTQSYFVPSKTKSMFNFRFSTNLETGKTIDDYLKSGKIESLLLPGNQVKDFEGTLNGIRIFETLQSFLISPSPMKTIKGDIRFENGIEIENVLIEIYKSDSSISSKISKNGIVITLTAKLEDIVEAKGKIHFHTDVVHKERCGTVNEEIEIHSLLTSFGGQESFEIFEGGKPIFRGQLNGSHPNFEHWLAILNHFKSLKVIEKHYKKSFSNIEYEIDEVGARCAELIQKFVCDSYIESKWEDAISIKLTQNSTEELKTLNDINPHQSIYIFDTRLHKLYLHGQEIESGYITYVVNAPKFLTHDIYLDSNGHKCCKLISETNTRLTVLSKEFKGPPQEDDDNIYVTLLNG